jgi:prophage maintenance system killer protein
MDGNKRTALVVCQTFLILNGASLTAPLVERYDHFYRLAAEWGYGLAEVMGRETSR